MLGTPVLASRRSFALLLGFQLFRVFYEVPRFLFTGFLGLTLEFSWPDTLVFLTQPSGFLDTTLCFFSGVSSAVAWPQVSLTSGLLSHAGLCGCASPRVVRPVPTSPGPWFPFFLRPGFLKVFSSPPTSCAHPFHGFLWPPLPVLLPLCSLSSSFWYVVFTGTRNDGFE